MPTSTVLKKFSIATGVSFIALGILIGGQKAEASTLFNDRTTFENDLNTFIVDDYENPGYLIGDKTNSDYIAIHSDASMSSVFGLTKYKTTGFSNLNIIQKQFLNSDYGNNYCAGCNGSFFLDFTQTKVGNAFGVFGAGFDILLGTQYFANVIFGDDTTQDFSLAGQKFWGITSDKSIKGINIGLQGGRSTIEGDIAIDNLTIGRQSVPEPALLIGLLTFGAFGAGSLPKRRQQQNAIDEV